MPSKRILVCGGAGFIGSHINKMLDDAGYETVVFDNLSTGDQRTVIRGTFVKGDLGNESDLDSLFSRYAFDAVMHFAAYINVGESVTNPAKYYINNVVNTIKLLESMRQHNVDTFIFSSTAALYGIPEKLPITEDHSTNPINPYGETKLMIEKALNDYGNAYGLKWCSLRYFNAAGGDPDGEIKNYKKIENNLIPVILHSLKDQGQVSIFGTDWETPDGTGVRDYIHLSDLGDAHIAAMEQLFDGEHSAIYNLGNGQGFSVREVIAAAEKVTGLQVNVVEGPRRPGDPAILIADASKAKEKLNWDPKYPDLETIIQHAWQSL